MAGALYGRIAAYESGLDQGEIELRRTVRQVAFATATPTEDQIVR
jgi:hypothetical protein